MRYAIAAMQNHLDAGYKTLPWWCHCCFTTVLKAPIPIRCVAGLFRRSQTGKAALCLRISLIDVTVMPDDEIMQHRRMALWS